MNGLRELYQEVIFDHNRNPRHFRELPNANRKAEGFNPLCGDKLTLYLHVNEDGVITEAGFQGTGCAISTASASLMTEALTGKTVKEAEALFETFYNQLMEGEGEGQGTDLGKLKVLGGVKEFPSRVKCATLAWHTLHAALKNEEQPVSTE